jgi:hypothetical protein
MSTEVSHKNLQNAVKDVNALFKPSPALKTIASRETLIESIVTIIGAAIQADDPRVDNLQRDTLDTYNALVSPGEAAEPGTPVEVQTAPEPEEEACPAYGTDFEPDAEECTSCARAEICAQETAQAKTAAKAATKATKAAAKPPKPPKPDVVKGMDARPAGVPTKKSIILVMLARPEGATVAEMAEAITAYNYGTLAKNIITVKLWMRKIGVPVEKREDRWYAVAPTQGQE